VTKYTGGSPSSVHTTDFAYDGQQIALQFDGTSAPGSPATLTANNLSHRYLNGPAVDQVLADEQLSPVTGGYDLTTPGNVVWTLTDQQNTVRDLATYSNGTTTVVNHLDYSPFGQILSQTNPATGNPAMVTSLFAYAGRPTDPATGLENDRARIYDAALMRFISEDPTSLTAGDTNVDRYCGNSPTNAVDPSGLAPSDSSSDGSGVAAYLDGLLNGNGNGQFSTLAKRFFSNAMRPNFQSLGEVGSFGKGLLIGFFGDGLWGNVKGIWDTAVVGARVVWYYCPWSVGNRLAQGDLFSGERYYLNKVQAIAGPALTFLNNLGTSLGEEAYREYDVITNGSPNDLRALGSQHRQVAAFMLGVAVELQELFTNLSPETKGRIEGVILWEVALTVGTVGVGQAAKAGRFAGILAKLQEWTEVPAIAQFVQRLGRSERLAELAASLDRLGGYVGEAVSAFKNLGVVRYVTGFVQTTENCCGITAIRYVLKLTGRTAGAAGEAAIDAAYSLLQTANSKIGLTTEALERLVRDVGFAEKWVDLPTREVYGGKLVCNTSHLLQEMEGALEAGPVIACSTGYRHLVVVEEIADGMVEVMDPADGCLRSVPWVDFCNWLSSQVKGAGFISLR
jgi:RHS repeat-associated protein